MKVTVEDLNAEERKLLDAWNHDPSEVIKCLTFAEQASSVPPTSHDNE